MKTIVQTPDEVLRKIAAPVPVADITKKSIQSLIAEMKAAVSREEDAVAIAAPQLGESVRIFVVAKKVNKKFEDDLVFINPEIIRIGKQKKVMQEGCLSVRWKYGCICSACYRWCPQAPHMASRCRSCPRLFTRWKKNIVCIAAEQFHRPLLPTVYSRHRNRRRGTIADTKRFLGFL